MVPLLDFDIFCYRSGFEPDTKGKDWLKVVDHVDASIYTILDRFGDNYTGYLTGKNNFRHQIYSAYKSNRKDTPRPKFYQEIRQYLIDEWGAQVTDGIEADDAIGLAHDNDTVVCSTDKDLKTLPGYFYHLNTNELEYIDEDQAIQNFLVQLLVGDRADNIPGLPNPAKAHHKNPPNFTPSTAKEFLGERETPHNLSEIQLMYEKHYKTTTMFDTIATLLWIQRKGAKTYKECNLLTPLTV